MIVWDVENNWRSIIRAQRDRMWASALDDYQRVARYENTGRPEMNWTDEELSVVERHWFNIKKHATNKLAADAVREDAKRLGLVRLMKFDETNLNSHFRASGRANVKRKPGKK